MPIYQADLDHDRPESAAPVDIEPSSSPIPTSLSGESLPADLCEGPVPDSPRQPNEETSTSDRAELIERLKRGESPTWIPNRHVCQACRSLSPWSFALLTLGCSSNLSSSMATLSTSVESLARPPDRPHSYLGPRSLPKGTHRRRGLSTSSRAKDWAWSGRHRHCTRETSLTITGIGPVSPAATSLRPKSSTA